MMMMMMMMMMMNNVTVMQLPGYRMAKRSKTARAGRDARSWQLLGTALRLLVTTFSTLKIAITIRSALPALVNLLCDL